MLPSVKFAWCACEEHRHAENYHCFALTLSGLERNLLCCQSSLRGLLQHNAAGP